MRCNESRGVDRTLAGRWRKIERQGDSGHRDTDRGNGGSVVRRATEPLAGGCVQARLVCGVGVGEAGYGWMPGKAASPERGSIRWVGMVSDEWDGVGKGILWVRRWYPMGGGFGIQDVVVGHDLQAGREAVRGSSGSRADSCITEACSTEE